MVCFIKTKQITWTLECWDEYYTRSIFVTAGICVTIILCEDFVYLSDSHSGDIFGMPGQNTFSINMKFDSHERVASYTYNLYVNSLDV